MITCHWPLCSGEVCSAGPEQHLQACASMCKVCSCCIAYMCKSLSRHVWSVNVGGTISNIEGCQATQMGQQQPGVLHCSRSYHTITHSTPTKYHMWGEMCHPLGQLLECRPWPLGSLLIRCSRCLKLLQKEKACPVQTSCLKWAMVVGRLMLNQTKEMR